MTRYKPRARNAVNVSPIYYSGLSARFATKFFTLRLKGGLGPFFGPVREVRKVLLRVGGLEGHLVAGVTKLGGVFGRW